MECIDDKEEEIVTIGANLGHRGTGLNIIAFSSHSKLEWKKFELENTLRKEKVDDIPRKFGIPNYYYYCRAPEKGQFISFHRDREIVICKVDLEVSLRFPL